jgi:hypothetical protein
MRSVASVFVALSLFAPAAASAVEWSDAHSSSSAQTSARASSKAASSATSTDASWVAGFSDVPSTHANWEAVSYVQAQAIVSGYADGTFRPSQKINRAEFTKIIVAANLDVKDVASCKGSSFSDVSSSDWFATFVCAAKDEGIVSGYADGTFRPGTDVNVAEAAKIITGAFKITLASPALKDPWYGPALRALADKGAIPTTIRAADAQLTRGEMAEIIYRVKLGIDSKPSKEAKELGL